MATVTGPLNQPLTEADLAAWRRDGYLFVRQLFDREEMALLLKYGRGDERLRGDAYGRKDSTGQVTKLALYNHPGDDLYSVFAQSRRIVDRMEQVLEGEVYLYHFKMMLKEPLVGGAWEWHQDYGYWYNNGCLLPHMASCLIAVDRATKANGCLQVLRGSQEMGRLEHGKTGDQVGIEQERIDQAMQKFELEYVEAEPGDALFFHGNLLHRSDQNTSPDPRWSLICCYNAARNSPYKEGRHPQYSYLPRVDDDAIRRWAAEHGLTT